MSKPAVHTELPWEVRRNEHGQPYIASGICILVEKVWSTIPAASHETEKREAQKAEEEANIAYIVRSVNSHDALVAALRGLVQPMQSLDVHEVYADEIAAAEAALKLAEEGL